MHAPLTRVGRLASRAASSSSRELAGCSGSGAPRSCRLCARLRLWEGCLARCMHVALDVRLTIVVTVVRGGGDELGLLRVAVQPCRM